MRDYKPYERIKHGGFGETDIIPISRSPLQVVRVSDNEVHAYYADVDDANVRYKQVWTAEGSGDTRSNPQQSIYISHDAGATWSRMY